MLKTYPLLTKPLLKGKIWGGRKLETLFGMELPIGKKIGEAWLVADLREGTSGIDNGPVKGKPLTEITKLWGEKLVGGAWKNTLNGGRFPLLIKFIDAQEDLSIQVHPDNEACKKYFPNDFSKDESWIILDADSNGKIFHGFQPGTTLQDFDRLLAKNKIVDCLRSVHVAPGDAIRVAPGTVHALSSGVVILEIQEPSDTTFRIFDYNRLDDLGKPRPLHIQESRKVIRFGDITPPKLQIQKKKTTWGEHELVVDVSAYRIERINVFQPFSWKINPISVQVLILLDSTFSLKAGGEILNLKKGNCVILPATLGQVQIDSIKQNAVAVLVGAGGVSMINPG